MFFLGFIVGFVIAVFTVSHYTRKRAGVLLARAYRLGYLESKAGMPVRDDVFVAISGAAYEQYTSDAAEKATQGIFVDSAMETVDELGRIRSKA